MKHSLSAQQSSLLAFEYDLWQQGYRYIVGVDEAGRGPLAGPVVAAAVMFSREQSINVDINDSKKLSAATRDYLYKVICDTALCFGVGIVDHQQIDQINILQATYLAMQSALAHCRIQPEFALVDGRGLPQLSFPARAIIRGDSLSLSIAAASIVAKVRRDRLMLELHEQYPEYGFAQHKGYPTKRHIRAIRKCGLSPIHRRSFRPKALEHLYAEFI